MVLWQPPCLRALVCAGAVTLIVHLMKLISSREMTHRLYQNPEAGDLAGAQIYFLHPPPP